MKTNQLPPSEDRRAVGQASGGKVGRVSTSRTTPNYDTPGSDRRVSMKPSGLCINLQPPPPSPKRETSRRRPLPTVPRSSSSQRTSFVADRPYHVGANEPPFLSEDGAEVSEVAEYSETEDQQDALPPGRPFPPRGLPPRAFPAGKKPRHRRSVSVDLTAAALASVPHPNNQSHSDHSVRTQGHDMLRPKSMSELPSIQPGAPSLPPDPSQLGFASYLRHRAQPPFRPASPLSDRSTSAQLDSQPSKTNSTTPSPLESSAAQAHLTQAKSRLNLRHAVSMGNLPSLHEEERRHQQVDIDLSRLDMQPSRSHDRSSTASETLLHTPTFGETSSWPSASPTSFAQDDALQRNSTLLSAGKNPTTHQRELSRLLTPDSKTNKRISTATSSGKKATNPSSPSAAPVALEQAKGSGKARVELDVSLESSLVVEGGLLKGHMEVKVKSGQETVYINAPKARIVGFEELCSGDARHVFYHHSATIRNMPSPFNVSNERYPLPCFEGEADSEGFFKAAPGVNSFPMSLRLPIGKGAKGGFKSKLGEVRYIVIGSIKLKAQDGSSRSIAHFYRHIEVFPYLDPALTLKSLDEPIKASASKSLFLGGDGKVKLTASIHRANWLAGQQCYINVEVINDSSKRVKSMTLSLNRTISTFKPLSPERFKGEPAPEIQPEQVSKKKMAETTLECGKKASHGGVTAKGSWLGVEKHRKADFMHSLLIPSDALSVSKGRHLEVTYAIRVAVAATLGPEISIDLPVNIVNFVSLDPPPGHLATSQAEEELMRRTKSNSSDSYNLQDINNFVMPRDATIRHPPPQHRASHSLTGPAISSSAYRAGGGSRLAPLESVEEKSELERSLRGSEEGGHSEGTLEASQPSDKEDLALDVWRYDEADDEECSDSQDEIETVLSLERPLPLSPLFSGRPDSLGLQRDAGFESPPSSPPRPQRAWSASDTGVRARLSPEACKRSAPMPQPVSPKRPARANLQNLSPQRRVSSSPRKSYAPVVEVSETDETPYPLASSMSATVRQRRPASTHLSPLQVNQGEMNQDSAGSSSPEPGLSPSIGASSPSTVTALTPPLDCDSHDDVLMHMLGSNSTSPVFAPTPKNMLKPWSPVVGKAAKSPGSSVRSRVAALESMSPELAMEQGRKPSSLYSVTSEATSLKRIVRAQSESSLKAPIWRNV